MPSLDDLFAQSPLLEQTYLSHLLHAAGYDGPAGLERAARLSGPCSTDELLREAEPERRLEALVAMGLALELPALPKRYNFELLRAASEDPTPGAPYLSGFKPEEAARLPRLHPVRSCPEADLAASLLERLAPALVPAAVLSTTFTDAYYALATDLGLNVPRKRLAMLPPEALGAELDALEERLCEEPQAHVLRYLRTLLRILPHAHRVREDDLRLLLQQPTYRSALIFPPLIQAPPTVIKHWLPRLEG